MTEPSGSSPVRKKVSAPTAPPGNTGTHWTGPNEYLYNQLTRTNYITSRRTPFARTSDDLCTALQRLVHYEGNRPPNRKILLHLRLLTYYPPNVNILPELITLLQSENVHVCRLAHYHVRQSAPITDPGLYAELVEVLGSEATRSSPARRAAATKTMAKVFQYSDTPRAIDFVMDVFNCIGGARVKDVERSSPRKFAGLEIPGTEKNKRKENTLTGFMSKRVIAGESYDDQRKRKDKSSDAKDTRPDDGAGGSLQLNTGNAEFIKSKFGKMLAAHTVFAAMRRINRIATRSARLESYLFDSGLLSIVPSTVRHCIALLEWRSTVAPGAVARYLVGRLPHKNPPAAKRLHLEDLSARVYFARLIAALAEDPDLSTLSSGESSNQARTAKKPMTRKEAMSGDTYRSKATGLFKFLFNKDRINELLDGVTTPEARAAPAIRQTLLKRDDPLGVDFAEALINLLKNASNRVLIEALRGLSRRRWTTWFEAPIPQSALHNSPELQDEEAYGGIGDVWGIEDDQDDEEEDDNENELGEYENDLVGEDASGSKGSLQPGADASEPASADLGGANDEEETWFSRLKTRRKERRVTRINDKTPFYLRQAGAGMVPALEVILRRINAALLHDEPIRRFSAADAVIVLARAKIYGHTKEDHDQLQKARSAVSSLIARDAHGVFGRGSQAAGSVVPAGVSSYHEERHPFQALVRPLAEIVHEDPNQYVKGRAAVALLFVIAAGAGRKVLESDGSGIASGGETTSQAARLESIPLLLRYFRGLVTHAGAGGGIGLRLISEIIDYLVYEVLDCAPELAPSAVEMAELWALTHPTVGVCGRLGALWEKALSMGQGETVGKSIFRAAACDPRAERISSAAVIFLRRRTLDLAIITAGSSNVPGVALTEPLPRAVGVEMEKYFSLLWHAALLGASAECRTFAVEALGGAAVLAGEPFRSCTYERLVELVKMRGLGLKIPAEQALDCLDILYFSRERFSEARAANRIARDGSNKSKKWLRLVWKLAAESSSAAQILLGVPPPTGWQPLGPAGAKDLTNAEELFGDVRDRQNTEKLKDAGVASERAPDEVPMLAIEAGEDNVYNPTVATSTPRKVGSGGLGNVPPNASVLAYSPHRARSRSQSRSRSRERRERGRHESPRVYVDDVDEYESPRYDSPRGDSYGRRRSLSNSPGGFRLPRSRSYEGEDEFPDRSGYSPAGSRGGESAGRHRTASDVSEKKRQEQADLELAMRLQAEETGGAGAASRAGGTSSQVGGSHRALDTAQDLFDGAADMAGKWLGKGLETGKGMTNKAFKAIGKKAAADRLKGER
eukprot:GFKZ01010410.1.p1 GENE.GFKZ01010410.1~~GFKZ01010410.1.p1  ORF type:complete len:1310 (+),score=187.90 GFKZ01010410.1:419-4348(+)